MFSSAQIVHVKTPKWGCSPTIGKASVRSCVWTYKLEYPHCELPFKDYRWILLLILLECFNHLVINVSKAWGAYHLMACPTGDYLLLVEMWSRVRGLSGRDVRWLGTNLKASIDTDRPEGRGPDRHASSYGRDLTWWKARTLDT